MAIIEEGKAAKRSDQLLDYISTTRQERIDLVAHYEAQRAYAFIVVQQLAQDCTPEQAEILLDLCKVLYKGDDDE